MKLKKVFFIFLGIVVFLVLAGLVLNGVAERKITDMLKTEMISKDIRYEAIEVNVWGRSARAQTLVYSEKDLEVSLKNVQVEGFHYWDYFVNDRVVINKILLGSLEIILRKTEKDSVQTSKTDKIKPQEIEVRTIAAENGKLIYLDKKDTLLSTEKFFATINSVRFPAENSRQNLPFSYETYRLEAHRIYYNFNGLHSLETEKAMVSTDSVSVRGISLFPKYGKEAFRERIPYERDRYHLKIDQLAFSDPDFNFFSNPPVMKSPFMRIRNVNFEIYRDKTVRDDPRTKKMYSAVLRDLDMKLNIQKTKLEQIFIKYQERVHLDRPPGTVAFYNLHATILNLANSHPAKDTFPKTKLDIHTRFMNTSDLDVEWQFDVSDESDYFTISGAGKSIPPEAMNPFFVPARHIRSEGTVDALYFNFSGDKIDATGEMKMEYTDFSITVLRKDGERKNKLLSAAANLFLKGSPDGDETQKDDIEVTRDPTKSFWNYFWSCIEKGLLKSMF